MSASTDNQPLQDFCNHVLRIGLQSKWEDHLVEPVHKNTALFARLYVQRADKSSIEAAATELEASLTICGTAHIETLAAVAGLVEELYELVDHYQIY